MNIVCNSLNIYEQNAVQFTVQFNMGMDLGRVLVLDAIQHPHDILGFCIVHEAPIQRSRAQLPLLLCPPNTGARAAIRGRKPP